MFEIKIESIKNDTELTAEEGYVLTQHYVRYFWRTNKFYSLKNVYEEEDVVSEIYCKFLEKGFFDKYNQKITSKKYFVMNSVRTSMIDMLRKYRDVSSLEEEVGDGLTRMDMIQDDYDLEEQAIFEADRESHAWERNRILMSLPDTTASKIVGYSELLGKEINISYRMLALHLEAGYTVKRLAEMYKNPKSGKSITQGNVSKHIANMREWLLDNVVLV